MCAVCSKHRQLLRQFGKADLLLVQMKYKQIGNYSHNI